MSNSQISVVTKVTFPVDITVNQLSTFGVEQLTTINDLPMMISKEAKTYEIAPLVSAEHYTIPGDPLFPDSSDIGVMRVRILVFCSNAYAQPNIGVTNNCSTFYIQEGEAGTGDGKSYNLWYFHFDLQTNFLVNQITVFNNLSDPKTSRGTVTIVQSTMPPVGN